MLCYSVKETTSSSDLAPDISFIKVEESDTGGLDMYVDIADDAKGGLLSNQEEGDDDTGEIPFEWSRDESNEGSNLSGDQSGSLPGQEGAFQGGFGFHIFCTCLIGMEISSSDGGMCMKAGILVIKLVIISWQGWEWGIISSWSYVSLNSLYCSSHIAHSSNLNL